MHPIADGCFFVRQILDTLPFSLTDAEAIWVEIDGSVLEDRRSGRPRRGCAKRRVREPGLKEYPLRIPLLVSPGFLSSEDAFQPADDLLVELDAVEASVSLCQRLGLLFAENARVEDPLVRSLRASGLVFADVPLAVGLFRLGDDHLRGSEEVAVVGPFCLQPH